MSYYTIFLTSKFNLEVHKKTRNFLTSTTHLNFINIPLKPSFIIAAPQRAVKPLHKAVTTALKLMYKQIETYNSKSPVQNNQPVIDTISKRNFKNKALPIAIYDFSTLYTNFPHSKLKNVYLHGFRLDSKLLQLLR